VCKAHRLVYHSTLGWRVIKKKKKHRVVDTPADDVRPVVAELNEDHRIPMPGQRAHLPPNPVRSSVVAELNEDHCVPVPCQRAYLPKNPLLTPRVQGYLAHKKMPPP